MAISGGLRVSATFISSPAHSFRGLASSKVSFNRSSGGSSILELSPKFPADKNVPSQSHQCQAIAREKLFPGVTSSDAEGFLLDAVNMSFLERLNLAWKILFPSTIARRSSNAKIAKQRLKMILFSDRCAVSDEAKRKIVSNIVGALSDFVEIDSQDKVQLSLSTDPDLGTVYSVTVPVRRVKPEYQDNDEDFRGITGIEYKDTGETSGSVDVRFDFFLPNDKAQ
ncbi:cell division topological specificity factor homolog, chloroplastic-like [Aristolochia californica]|uniref:cell division topological specificity factor homolog, chloroplastic-like n=1 Tax=Aristolochia californica TaxID=171875 RepID=UPI0035E1568F